jgi:hypothetical protein
MNYRYRKLCLVFAGALLLVAAAAAQDEPSLGDVARQARQQKQQNKDAQGKDVQGKPAAAKESKVITDESLPEHTTSDPDSSTPGAQDGAESDSGSATLQGKLSAEEWKSRIQAQKSAVDSFESNIAELEKSIQFAPGNCVAGCVEWNERQKQKQQEVERMKSQMESAKKKLEDMQEAARKQGYGSSVYEP